MIEPSEIDSIWNVQGAPQRISFEHHDLNGFDILVQLYIYIACGNLVVVQYDYYLESLFMRINRRGTPHFSWLIFYDIMIFGRFKSHPLKHKKVPVPFLSFLSPL